MEMTSSVKRTLCPRTHCRGVRLSFEIREIESAIMAIGKLVRSCVRDGRPRGGRPAVRGFSAATSPAPQGRRPPALSRVGDICTDYEKRILSAETCKMMQAPAASDSDIKLIPSVARTARVKCLGDKDQSTRWQY